MKAIAATCALLTAATFAHAKEWRGITPLKSNRADVERLLGQPAGPCRCVYDTGQEWVSVSYSGDPCTDVNPYRYRVPRDTVWEIKVRPKTHLALADLRLDLSKFEKVGDDWPFVIYYKNAKEGLIIEATACDKQVIKLFYLPAPKSDLPICTEDWNYDPASPVKIDKYSDVAIAEEQKRLDRLAAALRESPGWDGYIVSYAGQAGSAKDAVLRGERARRYLVKTRGVDARLVVTIYGGYQDEPSVEVFLWPDGWREYYGSGGGVSCEHAEARRK